MIVLMVQTKSYISVKITSAMLEHARGKIDRVRVNRTIASKIDTLTGILGEFVFAEYFYGDWRMNRIGFNKGETDFPDIEIKTSAFPFFERLNLLVREDYALKRKPKAYVQIIIDVNSINADEITADSNAYICGWATSEEVDKAPKRDPGSKLSKHSGYKCYYINIKELHPMDELKSHLLNNSSSRSLPSLEKSSRY
jgi:hypothetical protein